jgi:hypothetical protein
MIMTWPAWPAGMTPAKGMIRALLAGRERRRTARPTVLVSTGDVIMLDRDVVMGRNPRADFTGADGKDRPHVTVPIMLGTVVTLTESIDFRYEVYA